MSGSRNVFTMLKSHCLHLCIAWGCGCAACFGGFQVHSLPLPCQASKLRRVNKIAELAASGSQVNRHGPLQVPQLQLVCNLLSGSLTCLWAASLVHYHCNKWPVYSVQSVSPVTAKVTAALASAALGLAYVCCYWLVQVQNT